MANSIKTSAAGLALQVTKPARRAELVLEDVDGNAVRRADVYVYGVDDLLLVVDMERVSIADRAALVATAARDTESLHRGAAASVTAAGNGYQVQLPGCRAAGFTVGDTAPVVAAQGMLVVHDGTQTRLAEDLIAIRQAQADPEA